MTSSSGDGGSAGRGVGAAETAVAGISLLSMEEVSALAGGTCGLGGGTGCGFGGTVVVEGRAGSPAGGFIVAMAVLVGGRGR